MRDASEDSQGDQPRKRAAVGDGISAGSGSPYRESPSPPPRRSRARQSPESDLQRPPPQNKQLWTPEREPLPKSSVAIAPISKPQKHYSLPTYSSGGRHHKASASTSAANQGGPVQIFGSRPKSGQTQPGPLAEDNSDLIRQPETRPISQEQLVAEVKGIYAGLVMVEARCIEVDNKQSALGKDGPASQPTLNNEQWQALIALHRTLLHEHHDFFLASQHPSASPALRRLASKYAMPARMWRHGIHSFLELLRHRLPASLDHMLAFIYLAYSMMALLYETVPAFEDTWIECLGDLGRYRMAIEDDDIRDREVWTGVSRHWYSKASDKAPTTGRLYHHLAILARPYALQQLYYYSKSLCVATPFVSARESILTLFDPVLGTATGQGQYRMSPPLDTAFVKAHGHLFTNKDMEQFEPAVQEFLGLLDTQIGRITRKFMEQGSYIAISNIVAMLAFGSTDNPLVQVMTILPEDESDSKTKTPTTELSMKRFHDGENLANETLKIVLQRVGDPNVLPFIHVTLVFMYFAARHPRIMRCLDTNFPWQLLVTMLNPLLASCRTLERIESTAFPLPVKDHVRPFTEDFAMRGLLWAEDYYPESWFANDKVDDEEKHLEVASMVSERKERILWLACRIAGAGSPLYYDQESSQFSASPIEVPALDSRVSTFESQESAMNLDGEEDLINVKTEADEDGSGNEEQPSNADKT